MSLLVASCGKNEKSADNPELVNNRTPIMVSVELDENKIVDALVNNNPEAVKEFSEAVSIVPINSGKPIMEDKFIRLSYAIKNIGTQPISRVIFNAQVAFSLNETGKAQNVIYLTIPVYFDLTNKLTDVTAYDLTKFSPNVDAAQAPNLLLPGQATLISIVYNLDDLKIIDNAPSFMQTLNPEDLGFKGILTTDQKVIFSDGKVIDVTKYATPAPASEGEQAPEQTDQAAPEDNASPENNEQGAPETPATPTNNNTQPKSSIAPYELTLAPFGV
ncbi:hypothetical protein [Psittacicella hinzii]|uniref:Uncharacterized protein n=1 Tax=Psittacicella hinzii TaxID=2028575 RepID=A0A3A1YP61_9GAMM|nr:hypothetical protein [Psittacicella hinzii]RIY39286.1 hypothetical protein CKF58_02470 [Psittacicella hinzii]